MRSIRFLDEFASPIRRGRKRSTIRTRAWNVRPGARMLAEFKREPTLEIEVVRVSYTRRKDLRAQDAKRDGFRDLAQLHATIDVIYGERGPDELFSVIEFKVVR